MNEVKLIRKYVTRATALQASPLGLHHGMRINADLVW
jgi:hypothetical protein